ncbi:ornithine cyclodeaminase family protein [Advenella mimigardefordensis]|uniref:Putative ornithine cyclodeaminase n=1 Tax=Advenella mimigardefordensis (strain DSM 17166 / LMG 22922 / DPN7) TaxID=1247726 RepID=W0PIQ9_ADVMD|nr:ornithine cyclodeaminase family protein [Advenella mimigardefordensis]AHG65405.1 putative ornithine cyclodeaminase [Advenella mimigardefordensis DPN7]
MQHITDRMVDEIISPRQAQNVLRNAFLNHACGKAAMQSRIRTEAERIKLSTLGAVIPEQGVVGAKVYTTIEGQFNFVILLFSSKTGKPLATLDAGALTRIRTAACSVLAARVLARTDARTLGVFGVGVQGQEHVVQMAESFKLDQILIADPYADEGIAQRLAERTNVAVRFAETKEIASTSDIIVTASRSQTPVFSGKLLKPGAFVAAIGSSLPTTRELDDHALARAQTIVVEWKYQAMAEAGDLAQADSTLLSEEKLVELSSVLSGERQRQSDDDIFVYKAVGVGLEDIALAGLAYQLLKK